MICTAPGCSKPVWWTAPNKGMCQAHYNKAWRARNNISEARDIYPKKCIVCRRKTIAKGYCSHHYENLRLYGDPRVEKHLDAQERAFKIKREFLAGATQVKLADKYGLTPARIHLIVRGKKK